MQALIHSLNIGTLATWLSVAGFGTVGVIVPQWHPSPLVSGEAETTLINQDFTLGEAAPFSSGVEHGETTSAAPTEFLSPPPELAPMAELEPLPEIPALPAPAIKPSASSTPRKTNGSASASTESSLPGRRSQSASSGQGGIGGSSASSASSGMSSVSRLAAGRMPPPSYPAECRRKGQAGTVLVEFTVDSSGRVISAHAKSPSPWPLLNHEAVRTVRRWKFPPGGIMKLQRPIVFQLR
jgi:protein TonB